MIYMIEACRNYADHVSPKLHHWTSDRSNLGTESDDEQDSNCVAGHFDLLIGALAGQFESDWCRYWMLLCNFDRNDLRDGNYLLLDSFNTSQTHAKVETQNFGRSVVRDHLNITKMPRYGNDNVQDAIIVPQTVGPWHTNVVTRWVCCWEMAPQTLWSLSPQSFYWTGETWRFVKDFLASTPNKRGSLCRAHCHERED